MTRWGVSGLFCGHPAVEKRTAAASLAGSRPLALTVVAVSTAAFCAAAADPSGPQPGRSQTLGVGDVSAIVYLSICQWASMPFGYRPPPAVCDISAWQCIG